MTFGTRRGAVLFEVVLSVSLFVLAAALVGASVRAGLSASAQLAQRTRGLALAESLLAQIRADYFVAEDGDEGDFAPHFPDYRYQLAVVESEKLPALRAVTILVSWDVPAEIGRPAGTDSVTLVGWQYKEPEEGEEFGGESGESGPSGGSGEPSTGGGPGGQP